MNTSVLNYHLATVRTEDIERRTRRPRAEGTFPGPRRIRRLFAGGRRRRVSGMPRLAG